LSFDNFDPCFQNNTELFRFEIFMEDLHKFLSNVNMFKRQQNKLREYFIFVNLFCFKRKFTIHLSNNEERLTGLLVQFVSKFLPDAKPALMKSLCLLVCFFGSALSNFDRRMQAVLKSTIVNLPEVNLHLFSTLGIIFLCHNMPRTAEIFLEKPKENASKIKFLVFYDGCLKLVKLKASKRTLSRMIGSELKKTIAYFATLKEFRFAVDY
jgi:hypothetical protein